MSVIVFFLLCISCVYELLFNFSVVTNSGLLTTPLVTSAIKPPPNSNNITSKNNTYLSSLGPGTLILANGNVLPVLPQSATIVPQNRAILANPTPILVNPQSSNTTLIVVATTSSVTSGVPSNPLNVNSQITATVSSKSTKSLPRLKPKICLTKTVQVNKVPIPALSSAYSRAFSNQERAKTVKNVKSGQIAKKVVKIHQNQNERSADKVDDAKNPDSVVTKQTDSAKRKAEDSVETGNEAKKAKVIDSKSETKPAEEEKNCTDKDDPKKSSKYSIDSLCKEKSKDVQLERSSMNVAAKAAILETTVQEKNLNKPNDCEKSNEQKTVPDKSLTDTKSTQKVNDTRTGEKTVEDVPKLPETRVEISENILKDLENVSRNEDVPNLQKQELIPESKTLEISLPHSELSNDIFASLQVPTGGQNPESTSPTAAFLLAFPLVSTLTGVKVTEVMEEENSESQHGTPTLLQIGTMDTTKPTHTNADSLTPSLLNLDNFSFFAKDICSSFYPGFDSFVTVTTTVCSVTTTSVVSCVGKTVTDTKKSLVDPLPSSKDPKVIFETPPSYNNNSKQNAYISNNSYAASVPSSKSVAVSFGTSPAVVTSNSSISSTNNHVTDKTKNPQDTFQTSAVNTSSYNKYNPVLYSKAPNPVGNTMLNSNCFPPLAKSKPNILPTKNVPKSSAAVQATPYTITSTKPSYTIAQYNTFNPFTDITKAAVISSYANITRTYTDPLYTNSTAYNYNCQTDNAFAHNAYVSNRNSTKNENNKPYYSVNYDNNVYNSETRKYENSFSNNYCQMQNVQSQNKNSQTNKAKNSTVQPRPPVNWMTTPDLRQQAPNLDYLLPQFGKELDSIYPPNSFVSNSQTTYFNTSDFTANTFMEPKKPTLEPSFSNSFQKNDLEENQFSWSPTKLPQLLDAQNSFVTSTLPTLVGDLALGNTSTHFPDQKLDSNKNNRTKDNRRSNKTQNYDNQANFFSVSQLVEHNKSETVPARVTGRRNSGGRSGKTGVAVQKSSGAKRVHKEVKEVQNYNNKVIDQVNVKNHNMKQQTVQGNAYNMGNNQDWLNESTKTISSKNPPSSYSAEALISHQPNTNDGLVQKRHNSQQNAQNYAASTSKALPTVPFLTENIIPYFPSVDLQQENSFGHQQNQNYHQNTSFGPHNFHQSNAYSTNSLIANAPTITTNYLPTTNFMPDLGTTHEYNSMISDNLNLFSHASSKATDSRTYMKNSGGAKPNLNANNRTEERKNVLGNTCNANFSKKTKKKQANESNNLPGFVDFSFLSMPAAVNSPILPDDFHTNFLPPPPTPQLYSCKNSLYPKTHQNPPDLNSTSGLLPLPPVPVSRSNIQHPEISPSMNNAGTSLTNFNLSAIFPEINKVNFWELDLVGFVLMCWS